jgi:curved DNA-binding protein CbpA
MKTVQECLESLGVTVQGLGACADIKEEFACIKKCYREKVLATHPDKGGDPVAFRTVQASFEVLRELFSKKFVASYVSSFSAAAETHGKTWSDFEDGMPTKSWEFYYEAAESDVPPYRIERAKSGRSACQQMGKAKKCTSDPPLIEKGSIRIGSIQSDTGMFKCLQVRARCFQIRTCSL